MSQNSKISELNDDEAIAAIKASLKARPRLKNLICAALMELAADQITAEAIEENPDSI